MNTNQSSNPKRSSPMKSIFIFILTFIGLSLFASWWVSGQNVVIDDQGFRFTQYLNEKYDQDFIVENVRETGTGFAVKGSWRGDAYPKSDPSLKFEVRRSQTTDKIDYETFLQVLWTKQGMPEVEDFLAREFPDKEYYSLRISPGNSPGNSLYDLIQGETPSLDEALKNHKDIMAYELVINDVAQDISNEPSPASLERAIKIVNFVKSKEVGVPYITYGYRDASYTEKNNSGQQKYQYRIKLEHGEVKGVSSPDDLKQYFQAIEY